MCCAIAPKLSSSSVVFGKAWMQCLASILHVLGSASLLAEHCAWEADLFAAELAKLQLPQQLLKLLNLLLYEQIDPSRQVLIWNSALKCLDPPRQVLQQLVSQLAPSAQPLLARAAVEATAYYGCVRI